MKHAGLFCGTALFVASLCLPGPGHAQSDDWLAWHGCWQADGAAAGEYLCVVPDGAAGVRMATIAGGAVVAESRVVTDGRARRVQTDGCSGTEVAFWSADYHRVFLTSDLTCEADVKRRASGIFAMTGEASWMSIQAVTIDERTATRTVAYTAVADAVAPTSIRSALRSSVRERATARTVALSSVDADDVNEAAERIDAAAVQEWLLATGQPFQLAGEMAPALDDAVTRSALDHAGYFTSDGTQPTRDVVHIVERPVEIVHYVERPVYVNRYEYRYRSCWDPFFSGLVVGVGHGVSLGFGQTHCGRSYFTHYSPWGYDLFGWRFVHVRPIVVAGRPIIHYREPRRPPRYVGTYRRDDDRRATQPRTPGRSRPDIPVPVRTAKPRDAAATTRTAESRDPLPTFTGRTGGRVAPRENTGSTPSRYATPRTPASTSRPLPSTGVTSAVKSAEPRRAAAPPRAPVWTREPRSAIQPPTRSAQPRSAEPRAMSPSRPPAPSRSATPSRAAQPRVSSPAREPSSSGMRPSARTVREPAATPSSSGTPRSSAAAPARVAKPRGGEERH